MSWWYDYKAKQDEEEKVDVKKNTEDSGNEVDEEVEEIYHEYDLLDCVDYGREMLSWGMTEKDIEDELKSNIGGSLDKLKTKNGYYEIKIGKNDVFLLNDTKEVIY